MNRDERNHVLDSEAATPNQRGAIMRECDRLGLVDRAERLAILAGLLGVDALDSSGNLTQGDAGRLVRILRNTRERAELPEITAAAGGDDDGQDHDDAEDGEFISVAEAIRRIVLMFAIAVYGRDFLGESAHIGLNIQRLSATGVFPAQGRANSAN